MTSDRPMFPPAADSVHAFPAQPIRQPASENLTGEPAKAAEGQNLPMCQIIQFSKAARASSKRRKRTPRVLTQEQFATRYAALPIEMKAEIAARVERARDEGELSTTCKNGRLRLSRCKAWDSARRTAEYWRARLDWHHALNALKAAGRAKATLFRRSPTKSDLGSLRCGERRL
jgi:hypothetical protein